MYVMILNILVYAHDSLMVMLYYCKTLGRRYSMKVTVLAAVIWWVVQSASKLPFMYLAEDYNMNVIMVVPVSYTHLDVYKRQPVKTWARF